MSKKVIIIGPAHPLRSGGITSFNQRLCKQFMMEGYDCCIFSFSLQYPSFLFPGKSQYSTEPAPEGIKIYSVINSIHPLNWLHFGTIIRKMRPDLVIVRYWLPLMGPALGTILRRIQKNRHSKIIAIADNIIPHEKRPGDRIFTRYFLKSCDAFITMGEKVMNDLKAFKIDKPARKVLHPLYDHFGTAVDRIEARAHLGLPRDARILLFFGFIRKYKGLDILLKAMKLVKEDVSFPGNVKPILLVAGEFYEEEKDYLQQIQVLGIADIVLLHTHFIPESEVKYYLSAANVVVQPYRHATQSGVTPLAYHFEIPMIVTNVGSLPEQVPDKKVGLVCEPEPAALAQAIHRFFELGENFFLPQLRSEKSKYSWSALVHTIVEMTDEIKKE